MKIMSEQKKFQIVFVSKNNDFLITREESQIFEKQHENSDNIVNFAYVSNNKLPLADVYNNFILEHRNKKDINTLILMHADVKLNLDLLIQHINEVDGKYDIIGLCGCSKIKLSQKPFNWFTGSQAFPESRYGYVMHGEISQGTFFNFKYPSISDHEVACIDGLCIIFTSNALYNSDILFDNRFTFSHYDSDISLQAILQKKLKLGCIVQHDLMHYSVGKSILTEDFMKYEEIFKEKWKQYLI